MLVAIIIWQEISQFISSILNSKFIITILTSWPLAVVIIVMLLRKGILDKLNQLDSFNYKDGTAKFIRDTLEQVKTNQSLSTDNDSNQSENDNEPEVFENIYDPVAAVLVYWIKLEEIIDEAIVNFSIDKNIEQPKGQTKVPVFDKIKVLKSNGYIDEFTAKSIIGLRRIRNEVAHGVKISEKSANEFIGLCKVITKELKNKIAKGTN